MITYGVERLVDCLDELKPILQEHYKEIALYQDKIKLNPDYDKYLDLDAMGLIHTVVARDDGKIVGYYISFLVENMHYSDHIYAINDIVYVEQTSRGAGIAINMITFAENCYKALGVSVMMVDMKLHKPFEPLCQKLGMEKVEYRYSKYIGE